MRDITFLTFFFGGGLRPAERADLARLVSESAGRQLAFCQSTRRLKITHLVVG